MVILISRLFNRILLIKAKLFIKVHIYDSDIRDLKGGKLSNSVLISLYLKRFIQKQKLPVKWID
jgi:hypothetical protein